MERVCVLHRLQGALLKAYKSREKGNRRRIGLVPDRAYAELRVEGRKGRFHAAARIALGKGRIVYRGSGFRIAEQKFRRPLNLPADGPHYLVIGKRIADGILEFQVPNRLGLIVLQRKRPNSPLYIAKRAGIHVGIFDFGGYPLIVGKLRIFVEIKRLLRLTAC